MVEDKRKRVPIITTRLSILDQARFNEMCQLNGKSGAELARKAILEMLDRQEQGMAAEIKDQLAIRLKKMEDRLAALLARNNQDIGTIYQVLWIRSDKEKRDSLWATARSYAAKRASQRLSGSDLEIKEQILDEISS